MKNTTNTTNETNTTTRMTDDVYYNDFGIALRKVTPIYNEGMARKNTAYVFMAKDGNGKRYAYTWRLNDDMGLTEAPITYARAWAKENGIAAVKIAAYKLETGAPSEALSVKRDFCDGKIDLKESEYEGLYTIDWHEENEVAETADKKEEGKKACCEETKEERQRRILDKIAEENAKEKARRIAAFAGKKLKGNDPVVIPWGDGFERTEYTPEEFTKWFNICKSAEGVIGYDGEYNYDVIIDDAHYVYYTQQVAHTDLHRFLTIAYYYWQNLEAKAYGKLADNTYMKGCKNYDEIKDARLREMEKERAEAAAENGLFTAAKQIRNACENGSFLINPSDYDATKTASEYDDNDAAEDAARGLSDSYENMGATAAFSEEMARFHNEIKNARYGKTTKEKILKALHDAGNYNASLKDAMQVYDGIRTDGKKTTYRGIRKVLGIKAKSLAEIAGKK